MQYEIEAGGRLRHVIVSRTGDGFAVSVDGRLHQVDCARIDAHTLSLIVDTVWQRDTVVVPETGTGRLVVLIGGVPVAVRLNARRGRGVGAGFGGPRPRFLRAGGKESYQV